MSNIKVRVYMWFPLFMNYDYKQCEANLQHYFLCGKPLAASSSGSTVGGRPQAQQTAAAGQHPVNT